MGSGSKTVAFRMLSSANDVWTSIVAAPIVYPVGMRELYASIDRLIGDGVIEGSIRDITFGLGYRVVPTAREQITEVDHAKMVFKSRYLSHEGTLVPKVFDNFDTVMTVEPSSRDYPRGPGCTVNLECHFYTQDCSTRASLYLDDLLNVMQTAFQSLDNYVQRASRNGP